MLTQNMPTFIINAEMVPHSAMALPNSIVGITFPIRTMSTEQKAPTTIVIRVVKKFLRATPPVMAMSPYIPAIKK